MLFVSTEYSTILLIKMVYHLVSYDFIHAFFSASVVSGLIGASVGLLTPVLR